MVLLTLVFTVPLSLLLMAVLSVTGPRPAVHAAFGTDELTAGPFLALVTIGSALCIFLGSAAIVWAGVAWIPY